MNAQQTHGADGRMLISGFDLSEGIKPEVGYGKTKIHTVKKPKRWKKIMVVNLINSSVDALKMLGRHLEHEGHKLMEPCKISIREKVWFVGIDAREYRIYRGKILKL